MGLDPQYLGARTGEQAGAQAFAPTEVSAQLAPGAQPTFAARRPMPDDPPVQITIPVAS